MSPINIVLLGQCGSGKSTQADLLVKKYNFIHLDVGSSLRAVAKDDSELGRHVHEIINVRKELVPDDVIRKVLSYTIESIANDKNIVLDGAPRRESQRVVVEDVFRENHRSLDKVVFISLTEKESIERVASRFACSQCHAPYIISMSDQVHHSFTCDACGGILEQRVDDTPEGVRKRLEVFKNETLPVIHLYREKGLLLEVNGAKSVEEIHKDIVSGLGLV